MFSALSGALHLRSGLYFITVLAIQRRDAVGGYIRGREKRNVTGVRLFASASRLRRARMSCCCTYTGQLGHKVVRNEPEPGRRCDRTAEEILSLLRWPGSFSWAREEAQGQSTTLRRRKKQIEYGLQFVAETWALHRRGLYHFRKATLGCATCAMTSPTRPERAEHLLLTSPQMPNHRHALPPSAPVKEYGERTMLCP